MEVQEESISSWWVQGKALLVMCGEGALFGRADTRQAQFRLWQQ
ncbi:hypothetical protein [Candidatus Magnetaquicoccus inordinatus]|nr:hypothetical protein [Candidatus Magnetaquicoccus inordinatus]